MAKHYEASIRILVEANTQKEAHEMADKYRTLAAGALYHVDDAGCAAALASDAGYQEDAVCAAADAFNFADVQEPQEI